MTCPHKAAFQNWLGHAHLRDMMECLRAENADLRRELADTLDRLAYLTNCLDEGHAARARRDELRKELPHAA